MSYIREVYKLVCEQLRRCGRIHRKLAEAGDTLRQHLLGWSLLQSEHRGDHTAGSRRAFQEMGLEHVLAVVLGPAVLALEGPKGWKSGQQNVCVWV